MSLTLLTRADDLGSSHAANLAIARAAVTGSYIKNVSCMAVGPLIEEAADLLRDCKGICFGLHACLNSEWEPIRWGPICTPDKVPTLITEDGFFYASPSDLAVHLPDLDQVLREYDRQLDLLTHLGLDIRYVDSHMLPELFIPGLSPAMSDWACKKGLIDHLPYYRFPASMEPAPQATLEAASAAYAAWLDSLQEGGYFAVMHPAIYSREMLLARNRQTPAGLVAANRDIEYRLLLSRQLEQYCDDHCIRRVRYDEAESQGTTFADLQALFGFLSKEGLK